MFNLKEYLKKRQGAVEEALREELSFDFYAPAQAKEAVRYSTLGKGKRLRAILALAAAEAVGGNWQKVLPLAVALELIHAYSLIHDDLPTMDNSDWRRGKPSTHKVFGEAVAILAGDALLPLAFEIMIKKANGTSPVKNLTAIQWLSQAIGLEGMVSGQVADLAAEKQTKMSLESLEYIHSHKTGALLEAAVAAGGLLGGGNQKQLERLRLYGRHLGMAFQIRDDILDVTGSLKHLGKKPGADEKSSKVTFPALLGLPASRHRLQEETSAAQKNLKGFGKKAQPLRSLASYLLKRGK